VTLKNIVVDVKVDNGEVKDATVTDQMVEDLRSACSHGPIAPNDQVFSFSGATKTASGVEVTFSGSANNSPVEALTLALPALSPNGSPSGYDAALQWNRTDFPNLPWIDWTVTAQVHLAPK
jgi:hypothetical protein